MSQPTLSGEQLGVDTSGGVLRVTNDPGFTSDNGDGCPYRAVWVTRDGATVAGRDVESRTPVERQWPGMFASRSELAEWRQPLEPGNYRLRVYAGTLFKGWGDAPGDWIEWGYTDQGKNPSGVPRTNEAAFTVVGTTDTQPDDTQPEEPPPPADRRLELDPRLPQIRDATLVSLSKAKASFASWEAANPKEAAAVRAYQAALVDGHSPAPPELRTQKGRAIVGLLQAGAATVGRLP